MSQFGWGMIPWLTEDDYVPAYRWDMEGSPYYSLRPDRIYKMLDEIPWNYSDLMLYKAQHGLTAAAIAAEHSRGGGGPSVQSQIPLTSSSTSPQARASAQGGKSGAPARASTRGSRSGRKSCPKGHYWSYREKKCVKSKFR